MQETSSSSYSSSEEIAQNKKRRRWRSAQESPRRDDNRRIRWVSSRGSQKSGPKWVKKKEQPHAAQAPPVVAPSGSSTGRVVNPLRVQPPPAGAASSTSASRVVHPCRQQPQPMTFGSTDIRNIRQRIANLTAPAANLRNPNWGGGSSQYYPYGWYPFPAHGSFKLQPQWQPPQR